MQHFIEGFSVIFQMQYLLYMFGGVGIGLILGCLPGLTGSMGIALMLPFTYKMTITINTGLIKYWFFLL